MKKIKASATVETALMMPVILLVFMVSIYIMFYFHDKNIIAGAAYETAVTGTEKARWDEEELESVLSTLFAERIKGKLIFFPNAQAEISVGEDSVKVKAMAAKHRMKIHVEQCMNIAEPEEYIRSIRRIHGS